MSLDFQDLLDKKSVESPFEPGDHDRFAHYVEKEKLTDAMVFGHALEALCGKKWVPTRDGLRFPTCPECQRCYEELEDDVS